MRYITCDELKPALKKYMKGKYGRIDEVFFRQIGRQIRDQGYLTPIDLFCVLCWKMWAYPEALDLAFGSITNNSEEEIRLVTHDAIELANGGEIAKAIVKLTEPPTKLHGVRVRVASAILTFYDPTRYPVVDIHSWKALHCTELADDGPTAEEYERYVNDVREVAGKSGMTAHEVDAALWIIGGGKP